MAYFNSQSDQLFHGVADIPTLLKLDLKEGNHNSIIEKTDFLTGSFSEVLKQPQICHKVTYFKNDWNRSQDISLGPLCANMTKKIQKEVS